MNYTALSQVRALCAMMTIPSTINVSVDGVSSSKPLMWRVTTAELDQAYFVLLGHPMLSDQNSMVINPVLDAQSFPAVMWVTERANVFPNESKAVTPGRAQSAKALTWAGGEQSQGKLMEAWSISSTPVITVMVPMTELKRFQAATGSSFNPSKVEDANTNVPSLSLQVPSVTEQPGLLGQD